MFQLVCSTDLGRHGLLSTPHGVLATPFFLPVATCGAMKGLTHEQLIDVGAEALLCNTYHLHLQPGEGTILLAGGLHRFIAWEKPILTDSGGFQVFSLRGLSHIREDGVTFRSHRDGSTHFIGPVESMMIQHALGSDIIMCFDDCPPSLSSRSRILDAVDRTLHWARRCKVAHEERCAARELLPEERPLLFGIVQGGLEPDLRKKCAEELQAIGFDGFAIGGLAVGESESEMLSVLDLVCPILPRDAPRYLMGVGKIDQHRSCVQRGIDMFDCVLPMREARHGSVYLSDGTRIRIRGAQFAQDFAPLDLASPSQIGTRYSRAYVRHLLHSGERLGETIACTQNMAVTLGKMHQLRQAIVAVAEG